jgi:hypothetical protein
VVRTIVASVVAGGALLVAGAVGAQTAGPPVGPGLVPLTGPSPAAAVAPAPSPEPVVATVPGPTPKATAIQGTGAAGKAATAPPRKVTKVAHKPGPKATVKKVSWPNRVAKTTARPAKPKHVAAAKHPAPTRKATVSAPIPLNKPPSPTKGSATAKPVLPRV